MPLIPGSDEKTIGTNIAELIRSGYPPKQAAAIAYDHAGVSKDVRDRHTGHHKKRPPQSARGNLGPDDT